MWAAQDVSIMLVGETGTGKEVFGRAIHELSGRRGPLVALNCAAIPESLAEAELFGYVKGAFTGAQGPSPGHIAMAHHGTLFLDEIADLPLGIQAKLLRVLERRAVTPLGTQREVTVDFRLATASHSPLETLVEAGLFRPDLHARLSGATIVLPPLRERRQEIAMLFAHGLQRFAAMAPPALDSRLIERLCLQDWPYNVRELLGLAKLLANLEVDRLGVEHLPSPYRERRTRVTINEPPQPPSARRAAWLERHQAELTRLRDAMRDCDGNVSEAARQAGIPRHRARRLLDAARVTVEAASDIEQR